MERREATYTSTPHPRQNRADLPPDTLDHARRVDRVRRLISKLDQCVCGACDRFLEACQVGL